MNDNLKLLAPVEEAPKPQFPLVNFQFAPQGVAITIALGPTTTIVQTINEVDMNNICQEWLKTRKDIKRQMDLAAEVIRSKNRN